MDWTTPRADLVQRSSNGSNFKTLVSAIGNSIVSFAWNPAGDVLSYLINTPSTLEWHIARSGSDQVLASLPYLPPTDGRPIVEPLMVSFSADGKFVAMTDFVRTRMEGTGDNSKMQIRTTDGSRVASAGDSIPLYGFISDLVWVGSSLYFRDGNGIEVWTASGVCSALPGVDWIRPKLSPDGKLIVFHTEDANQLPHVFVYDLATKQVEQVSPAGGAEAWFLGSDYVWFLEERFCAQNEPCGVSNARLTGKSYIANLASHTTSESRITRIADTWPRPGAPNFNNSWWMDASATY